MTFFFRPFADDRKLAIGDELCGNLRKDAAVNALQIAWRMMNVS